MPPRGHPWRSRSPADADDPSILVLPDDLLMGVLIYLLPDTLSAAGATCRRLHDLAGTDRLWHHHVSLHMGPDEVAQDGPLAEVYRSKVQTPQYFPAKLPIPLEMLPPSLRCLRDVLRDVAPEVESLDIPAVLSVVAKRLEQDGERYTAEFAKSQTQLLYHQMAYRCILRTKVRELRECARYGRSYEGWRSFVAPPTFSATASHLFQAVLGPWHRVPDLQIACLQEFLVVIPLLRQLQDAMAQEYGRQGLALVVDRCRAGLGFGLPPEKLY